MADGEVPTNDRAVFALCEMIALAFILPPGEALWHGDSVSGRMVGFFMFGAIWLISGIFWPRLKHNVGRRFSASVVRVASDFRWWLAVTFGLLLYLALLNPLQMNKPGQVIGYLNNFDTGEVVSGSLPAVPQSPPVNGESPTHKPGYLTSGEKWQLGKKMREFDEYILTVIYYSDRAKAGEEIVDVAEAGGMHAAPELANANLPDGITVCGRATNPHVQQFADLLSSAYNEKVGVGDCGKGPSDDSLRVQLGAPS